MKPLHLRALLLLAAVLLGQWLGIAHAVQHDALEPGQTLCVYCVSGIGSGPLAPAQLPQPALSPAHDAPLPARQSTAVAVTGGPVRNRGPPQHS